MPDLQSELSKIANAWDTHEQTIRHDSHEKSKEKEVSTQPNQTEYTGNMSRDLYMFVIHHPNEMPQADIAHLMVDKFGYKYTSVQALITQMKRNGMLLVDEQGKLVATQDEYKPFANPYKTTKATLKAKAKAKTKSADINDALSYVSAQVKPQAGLMALQPTKLLPVQLPAPAALTADSVLASISVSEAFKLYQELSKMFGGK